MSLQSQLIINKIVTLHSKEYVCDSERRKRYVDLVAVQTEIFRCSQRQRVAHVGSIDVCHQPHQHRRKDNVDVTFLGNCFFNFGVMHRDSLVVLSVKCIFDVSRRSNVGLFGHDGWRRRFLQHNNFFFSSFCCEVEISNDCSSLDALESMVKISWLGVGLLRTRTCILYRVAQLASRPGPDARYGICIRNGGSTLSSSFRQKSKAMNVRCDWPSCSEKSNPSPTSLLTGRRLPNQPPRPPGKLATSSHASEPLLRRIYRRKQASADHGPR